MTYLGVHGPGGSPSNQYTEGGLFNQPHRLAFGVVLAGFQSSQFYDIALDHGAGRTLAIFLGTGRGRLGVNESGGIMPGERVLVAIPFESPMPSIIVAKYGYARAGAYEPPCNLLVYPQVAGFKYNDRSSGQAYANFPRLRNYMPGVQDVVDGEWLMHNMFGGAVGVEMFRSYIKGGPMSGVYCYTEDQTTRIVGAQIEFISLGESIEELPSEGDTAQVRKRYFYANDRFTGFQPQVVDLVGPGFGGKQSFQTYPDGLNGSSTRYVENDDGSSDLDLGESRVALIHEYRGADGSYALTAANSILLQKSVEVPVPIDVVEAKKSPTAGDDEQVDDCACGACPLTPDPDPNLPDDEECDDSGAVRFDSNAQSHPLAFAMNARGLANRLILWQAMGSFDPLCRWGWGEKPKAVYGGRDSKDFLTSASPSMWKCMPQTVKLGITPGGAAKRFYLGHALITISEDGSIVLQDAHGSQIMLSGGNIVLSAQHDVITTAGRNKLDIVGRDAAIHVDRHLDVATAHGRLNLVAAQQASLVGGMDGESGVLIESKGTGHQRAITTGENPASSSSVIIKSNSYVGIDGGRRVHIRARGNGFSGSDGGAGEIDIDAGKRINWQTYDNNTTGYFGTEVGMFFSNGDVIFGGRNSVINTNLYVERDVFFKHLRRIKGAPGGAGPSSIRNPGTIRADRQARCIGDWLDAQLDFANNPLQMGPVFVAKFLSSQQYTVGDGRVFTLPEPEWQSRAAERFADGSAVLNAKVYIATLEGSNPFPGSGAVSGFGMSRVGGSTADFNGRPSVNLGITQGALSGSLLKGI